MEKPVSILFKLVRVSFSNIPEVSCTFASFAFFVQGMFSVQTGVSWPYHFLVIILIFSLICFAIIGSFVFPLSKV